MNKKRAYTWAKVQSYTPFYHQSELSVLISNIKNSAQRRTFLRGDPRDEHTRSCNSRGPRFQSGSAPMS